MADAIDSLARICPLGATSAGWFCFSFSFFLSFFLSFFPHSDNTDRCHPGSAARCGWAEDVGAVRVGSRLDSIRCAPVYAVASVLLCSPHSSDGLLGSGLASCCMTSPPPSASEWTEASRIEIELLLRTPQAVQGEKYVPCCCTCYITMRVGAAATCRRPLSS